MPEADRLHASDAARGTDADRFARVFDLTLRAMSPALAATLDVASDPVGPASAAVIVAAIIAVADGGTGPAVGALDALRHSGRMTVRRDAIMGQALLAALRDVLGSSFDEATRNAWANGYVRAVETVMAGRRNRIDLVA